MDNVEKVFVRLDYLLSEGFTILPYDRPKLLRLGFKTKESDEIIDFPVAAIKLRITKKLLFNPNDYFHSMVKELANEYNQIMINFKPTPIPNNAVLKIRDKNNNWV